jgi:hypothetical protein
VTGRRVRAHTVATVDRANHSRLSRSRMVQSWLDHPPDAPAWRPPLYGLPCPENGCHTLALGTTEQLVL